MSTLFFGHAVEHEVDQGSFPRDAEGEAEGNAYGRSLTPVTWLPARGREEDEVDSTRGY